MLTARPIKPSRVLLARRTEMIGGKKTEVCSRRAGQAMALRASLRSATTSQAPSPSNRPLSRSSTSTRPTTRVESLLLTKGHKKCRPLTDSSAFRTTLDSSGTASTARYLVDLVSTLFFSGPLVCDSTFFLHSSSRAEIVAQVCLVFGDHPNSNFRWVFKVRRAPHPIFFF